MRESCDTCLELDGFERVGEEAVDKSSPVEIGFTSEEVRGSLDVSSAETVDATSELPLWVLDGADDSELLKIKLESVVVEGAL